MHPAAEDEFDRQAAGVLLWLCGWILRGLILAAILFGIAFPIAASKYQKKHPTVVVKPRPGETFR